MNNLVLCTGRLRAHWRGGDPAAEPDRDAAFTMAYDSLKKRAQTLLALPIETMDQDALNRIGKL